MIYLEQENNIFKVLTQESDAAIVTYRVDLTHIQSNNLYPVLITNVVPYNTYVDLIFDINSEYEEGEYKYEIYKEDTLIDSGVAYYKYSADSIITSTYNKNVKRTIYERY